MPAHAMAMVKWEIFRPDEGSGRFKSLFYASKQKRLANLVGHGGTLWLITSRRRGKGPRAYHLAYKLAGCAARVPAADIEKRFGPYLVEAQDSNASFHFPYNDATSTLMRLRFTSGNPITTPAGIGYRLQSIPELTPDDIDLMEAFEQRVRSERSVFLSYARQDKSVASQLERELEARNIHVFRDETAIVPGDRWEDVLRRAARGADAVLVLVSAASAQSSWVRREVDWAMSELQRPGGLVTRIVAAVLDESAWSDFPQLHPFQRLDLSPGTDAAYYDHLALELQRIPRRSGSRETLRVRRSSR